jgi:hypothetical protein
MLIQKYRTIAVQNAMIGGFGEGSAIDRSAGAAA